MFTNTKALKIPEGDVAQIAVNGIVLWKKPASYKNWVKYSTESDGKTIYNGGLGYKDGYRVRSGGAEAESDYSSCTGFIPYKKGDKLYIYPNFTGENVNNAVNFYDNTFACLGQITDSDNGYGICSNETTRSLYKTQVISGVSVLDISNAPTADAEKIAYVRITHNSTSTNGGANLIITVNEEITL